MKKHYPAINIVKYSPKKVKMKRLIIYSILSVVTLCSYGQSNFNKTEIKSIMKRVADWQIANPATGAEHDDLNWTYAALYMGMIDWAELTEKEDGDSHYNWLLKIGRRNARQMGKYMYHADFIAVGKSSEMYQKYNDRNMMFPTRHAPNSSSTILRPARWNWIIEIWQARNAGHGVTPCSWLLPYMPKCIC